MKQDNPGILARLLGARPTLDVPAPTLDDAGDAHPAEDPFTCTTCGRSDLPEAGDWDPPICEECDAAINFDALEEQGAFDD